MEIEYLYYLIAIISFIIARNICVYVHESGHAYFAKKNKIKIHYFITGNTSFTKIISFSSSKNGIIKYINFLGINGFVLGNFTNLNKKVYREISKGAFIFESILLFFSINFFIISEIFFSSFLSNGKLDFFIYLFSDEKYALFVFIVKLFLIITILYTLLSIVTNFIIPFIIVFLFPKIKIPFLFRMDGGRFASTYNTNQKLFTLVKTDEDYYTLLSYKKGLPVEYQNDFESFVKKTYGYLTKENN